MAREKYIIRLKVDAHREKAGRCIGLSAKAAEEMIKAGDATLVSKTYSLAALVEANEPKQVAKAAKVAADSPTT